LCVEDQALWFKEIAEILKKEFGTDYTVKTGELSFCLIKMASWFDPAVKMIIPMWNKPVSINNSRIKNVLGIQFRSKEESIIEMTRALIKYGYIKERVNKKLVIVKA
jgi:hypothetical protein